MKIQVSILIGILTLIFSAFVWYDNTQATEHDSIKDNLYVSGVELSLQQVDLELKLYRSIEERRALTPDEVDRQNYLKSLRAILLAEQRKQVA